MNEQFPMLGPSQDKMVVQSCDFFTITATTTRREKDAKIQSIAGRRLECALPAASVKNWSIYGLFVSRIWLKQQVFPVIWYSKAALCTRINRQPYIMIQLIRLRRGFPHKDVGQSRQTFIRKYYERCSVLKNEEGRQYWGGPSSPI